MELALVTAEKVCELFLLIFAGLLLSKAKVVRPEHKKVLSGILINFVVPCMIIDSYLGQYEKSVLKNLGNAFLYSILLFFSGMAVAFLLSFRVPKAEKSLYRFACTFSNAAYMGFPLIRALFGEEGILYASAYITVFNVCLWSVGYLFFTKDLSWKDIPKQLLHCPPIYAVVIGIVIYMLQIPVGQMIASPVGMVGDMVTPLAMIITGVTMAETKLLSVLKKGILWRTLLVRHIVVPCIGLGIFLLCHFHGTAAMVTLIQEACPVASITTMLAIEYDSDAEYAAGLVVISTLLSILSLPLFAYMLQTLGI